MKREGSIVLSVLFGGGLRIGGLVTVILLSPTISQTTAIVLEGLLIISTSPGPHLKSSRSYLSLGDRFNVEERP